jgi:hypothetical protein
MGILAAVIEPPMSPVFHARHDLLLGCLIASKFVRDHHAWDVLAIFEQFAKELFGRCLVSPALHQDIQHVAILIDCPPQILRLTVDFEKHFVQKPLVSGSCSSTSELIGVRLAELP